MGRNRVRGFRVNRGSGRVRNTAPARYSLYYHGMGDDVQNSWRAGTTYAEDGDDEKFGPDGYSLSEERRRKLFARAEKLEKQGRRLAALDLWKKIVAEGLDQDGQARHRSGLLGLYAKYRHMKGADLLIGQMPPSGPSKITLSDSELDPKLQPFAHYARADSEPDCAKAGRAFLAIANDYPRSSLAEPALIMVPRTLLKEDATTSATDFDTAKIALDDLDRRFPHSRFAANALGWRGRISYLKKDYSHALAFYRMQYAASPVQVAVRYPLQSIILCEQHLGNKAGMVVGHLLRYGLEDNTMAKMASRNKLYALFDQFAAWDGQMLWSILRTDPQVLSYYMDFRLDSTQKVGDLVSLARANGETILRSKYRAQFASRVAEAAFRNEDYVATVHYAQIALNAKVRNINASARAQYLLGSIARRTGKPQRAIRHYEAILAMHPASYLRKPAQECLALLYEGEGRFAEALDIYREFGYTQDVAYMLDMRMTPRQIERYLASHASLKKASVDRIEYTLGLRYMRQHRWSDAERWLSKLNRKRRLAFVAKADQTYFDPTPQQDPLKSTRELARLDRAVHSAGGPNRKAKALLAMAQYFNKHRDLTTYNGPMWDGQRAETMTSWNQDASTAKDRKALERHHWDHEDLAQCLLLCRRILKECPKTPLRFQVAYLAATAADRLANFNPYWRWVNESKDLELESVHWMKVASKSPQKSLAARAAKYEGVFADQWDDQQQRLKEYRADPSWDRHSWR